MKHFTKRLYRRIQRFYRDVSIRFCKSLLRRFHYGIYPVSKSVDAVAALTVKESEYYKEWHSPCPLFSPWTGHPDFQKLYEGIERYTIVSPDRCYVLSSLANHSRHLEGDFAECGVYKGGTALLLCRVIDNSGKKLFLFDSFEGLPQGDKEKDQWFKPGQFSVDSVKHVEELLRDFKDIVEVRKGWIPDTFAGLERNRFSFAHVDVDLYQSALDCCEFFYPRLVSGGILLFDEYGFPAARGEKDAVDEFFADKPESPLVLPTGQAFVIKLPARSDKSESDST